MSRRLSLVLHTHMPYVEGFGTWPFGEEWLWEAWATSYVPLCDVLDAHPGRVTLSVTPVLADQLAAPGVSERYLAFLRDVREVSHALDFETHPEVRPQLEHSLERYRRAAEPDLLARFAKHATWTSSATHAILPLLATEAGLERQVRMGVDAFRERFGRDAEGFWLPECAQAPWVLPHVEGVACVELPGVSTGALRAHAGLVLAPLDRALIDLVWAHDGYPSAAPYLDTRRFTERRHLAWAVGGDPYDPAAARARARADAADFAARVPEGWSVVAIDTELLGHWWAEGVDWLAALLEHPDLELVPLTVAYGADAVDAGERGGWGVSSWGRGGDLRTWSGPSAQGIAWRARAAELRGAATPRQVRELLALQSSDWAFLVSEGTAGPYPLERFAGHERALAKESDDALRGLAPFLT